MQSSADPLPFRDGARGMLRADWGTLTTWAALGLCLAAAVGLRFYAIDRLPGINGDEPQYAVHAHSFFAGAALKSLRTGSDLPMNPVFFGTVLLLQKLLPITLWSLRLAPTVLSVLTIYLAWALFRHRGRMFALTFACLVAVLPIHLGYARFAWDPSAIPTASVLALGAAAQLRPLLCLLAMGLALWVHPTTVFLVPTLALPFVAARWPRDRYGAWLWSRPRLVITALGGLFALPATALVLRELMARDALPGAVLNVLQGDLLSKVVERAEHPAQLGRFIVAFGELLCGPTIYRYIVGSMPEVAARVHMWTGGLVLLPLLAAGVVALARRRRRTDLALAAGLAASLLAEYLLAGPTALAPKTERYAVCLTIPACYVIAACLDVLADRPLRANALRAASAAVSGALLLSFSTYYLAGLHQPDFARENTFRTGLIEPKQSALEAVRRIHDPTRAAVIYVEDWWIYWTIRYLAPPSSGTWVTIYKQAHDYRFPPDFDVPEYSPAQHELFGITWVGHRLDAKFARQASGHVDIGGYEPGPILRVHKLRSPPRP